MHVSQIWQYPVKTMIGGTVEAARVDGVGIRGDREWVVRDATTGSVVNARSAGSLMQFAAQWAGDDEVEITVPDGATVRSSDPQVDAALSAALGRPVALQRRAPATDEAFYRRAPFAGGDPMAELRSIFAREEHEPLPDFAKFPAVVMEYETPPGALYDCYPLLLLSTSALRSLAAAVPGSIVDVRRFRPSLVLDTGDEPGHPELAWAGRRFRVGDALVEVVNDCPRCAAITKQIATDVPTDRAILRHVVKDLGQAVGAYARVLEPGRVQLGDTVAPA